MKWLIAKRIGTQNARETDFRFKTKLQAMKKASKLNKEAKKLGAKVKYMVRRVGWRRKRYWS
jgi:hypothetical protein